MITEFGQIDSLFSEMSSSIEEEVDIYLIGGGALMYHKSKNLTKDIDIVVNTKEEFESVQRSLENSGFESKLPDHNSYSRLAITQVFIRDEFRIDLFCKTVCNKFSLSDGMMKRAVKAGQYGKIALRVCSVEDILLFKCMTERSGDLDDCIRINYEHLVNWSTVLEEAQEQSKIGEGVWITWITSRLEALDDAGIRVPILKEMCTLTDKYNEKWEQDLMSRNPDKF